MTAIILCWLLLHPFLCDAPGIKGRHEKPFLQLAALLLAALVLVLNFTTSMEATP